MMTAGLIVDGERLLLECGDFPVHITGNSPQEVPL
jgi:hypothetical protein